MVGISTADRLCLWLFHGVQRFMMSSLYETGWLKNHLEKWWSESQWGWDDIPYMKWKLKFMFETTNQCFLFAFWKKCILKFFANTRLFQHLQMAFITCSTWKPRAGWPRVKLYLSWSDLLWYLHIFKINSPLVMTNIAMV